LNNGDERGREGEDMERCKGKGTEREGEDDSEGVVVDKRTHGGGQGKGKRNIRITSI
jgi:hypothetical protein